MVYRAPPLLSAALGRAHIATLTAPPRAASALVMLAAPAPFEFWAAVKFLFIAVAGFVPAYLGGVSLGLFARTIFRRGTLGAYPAEIFTFLAPIPMLTSAVAGGLGYGWLGVGGGEAVVVAIIVWQLLLPGDWDERMGAGGTGGKRGE